MIIQSIEITNFISHEKTIMNFEIGVNIITGKNGAGKTSILDAIKFALFSDSRNNEKINELIKNGKKSFDINLVFTNNNHQYEVYKHFAIKSAKNFDRTAYLKEDSKIIAETYEGVTSAIIKILSVSKDIFKNSVFVEQGEMDSLISGTPKERKTIFSDIIGITSLSKNAEKLKEIINRFRNELMLLQGSNDKMNNFNDENKLLNEQNQNLREEYNKVSAVENDYRNKINEMEKVIKIRDNLKSKIDNNYSMLKQYSNDKTKREDEMKRISLEINKLKDIEDQLNAIESNNYYKNGDKIRDYFDIRNQNITITETLQDLKKNINTYNDYRNNISKLENDYNNYINIKEIYNKNRDNIKNLMEYYSKYNEYTSIIKNNERRSNEIVSFINKNMEKYSIKDISDIQNIKNKREEINNQIIEYNNKISEIKSKVSSSNPYLKEYNSNIQTLEGNSICPLCGSKLSDEHLKNIINEYKNRINGIIDDIASLKKDKEHYDMVILELKEKYSIFNSDAIDKIISFNNELKNLNENNDKLKPDLNNLREKYDNYINLNKQNEEYEKTLNRLQENYDKYNKYRNLISAMNIDEINNKLDEREKRLNNNNSTLKNIELSINFIPDENEFKKINNLSMRMDALRMEKDKLIAYRSSYDNLKSAIEEINNHIITLNDEIDRLKNDLDQYNNLDNDYNNLKESYDDTKGRAIKLETIIKNNGERIEHNNEEISKLKDDVDTYNKINDTIKKLNKVRESLDYNGIQSMIRKDSSASITNLTRKYLLSFNLDFDDISIDENFDIKISQNSMEQSIDSLSGGEKTALTIALRLSVAEYVLNRISTIIMDEPTNFLDEDRRNNLKDIIQYSLKGENLIPQIIIITHHSELTSVADISYEVIKEKGISKVITN